MEKPVILVSQEVFEKKIKDVTEHNKNTLIEDFEKGVLHLRDYSGVRKFKSIRRAIRRGHISVFGEIYPKRPFKNISRPKGSVTYNKKRIYEQLKHRNRQSA
jgi:hypothetical protein